MKILIKASVSAGITGQPWAYQRKAAQDIVGNSYFYDSRPKDQLRKKEGMKLEANYHIENAAEKEYMNGSTKMTMLDCNHSAARP